MTGYDPRENARLAVECDAQSIDLGVLLCEITTFIDRYVVLTRAQRDATVLWVAHTHVFGAAETTPYLHITSPEKACGKTRLLETLDQLVARPWLTARTSACGEIPPARSHGRIGTDSRATRRVGRSVFRVAHESATSSSKRSE